MSDNLDISTLTADALSRHISAGELSVTDIATGLLRKIAARDHDVQAWAHLDPEQVLSAAAALDKVKPAERGPLHGVPFAAKDNIDTFDMPTAYGSAIHDNFCPHRDASCIASMRLAGALLLGKTVSTEFAHRHPGKTRNPIQLDHTPGGSSSGSAAAVAAGMVPIAFGTQTTGSVIRPAAYCGVIGYKPTYGDINISGVLPNTPSFDTVGIMARCIEDVALARAALLDGKIQLDTPRPVGSLRIGVCKTVHWPSAEPEAQACLDLTVQTLSAQGARVEELGLKNILDDLDPLAASVSGYEFARTLAHERRIAPGRLSAVLREGRMAEGLVTTYDAYRAAQVELEHRRIRLDDALTDYDALLCLPAPGAAPAGLDETGSAVFNLPWTTLHTPTLTLPVYTHSNGLPLGIALVNRRGADRDLLTIARSVIDILR